MEFQTCSDILQFNQMWSAVSSVAKQNRQAFVIIILRIRRLAIIRMLPWSAGQPNRSTLGGVLSIHKECNCLGNELLKDNALVKDATENVPPFDGTSTSSIGAFLRNKNVSKKLQKGKKTVFFNLKQIPFEDRGPIHNICSPLQVIRNLGPTIPSACRAPKICPSMIYHQPTHCRCESPIRL